MKDKKMIKTIATLFFERIFQLMFWAVLGYLLIKFGVPLLGDAVGEVYQNIRAYFVEAPIVEKAAIGFLGIF